jgi:hypothetical protein
MGVINLNILDIATKEKDVVKSLLYASILEMLNIPSGGKNTSNYPPFSQEEWWVGVFTPETDKGKHKYDIELSPDMSDSNILIEVNLLESSRSGHDFTTGPAPTLATRKIVVSVTDIGNKFKVIESERRV